MTRVINDVRVAFETAPGRFVEPQRFAKPRDRVDPAGQQPRWKAMALTSAAHW